MVEGGSIDLKKEWLLPLLVAASGQWLISSPLVIFLSLVALLLLVIGYRFIATLTLGIALLIGVVGLMLPRFQAWEHPTKAEMQKIREGIALLPPSCPVKISAPVEKQALRDSIAKIAREEGHPVVDDDKDLDPDPHYDLKLVNATPTPLNGCRVIHSSAAIPHISYDRLNQVFAMRPSSVLPPNSDPHLIWLQIGDGEPWRGFNGCDQNFAPQLLASPISH